MSACVSSDFCFETASMMDLVCWATASAMECVSSAFCCASATATAAAMVLASEASRVSWSRLWFSAVAFSSLDRLPITRSRKVRCFAVFYGVLQCFEHFRTSVRSFGFEALKLCSSEAL